VGWCAADPLPLRVEGIPALQRLPVRLPHEARRGRTFTRRTVHLRLVLRRGGVVIRDWWARVWAWLEEHVPELGDFGSEDDDK
jgi:hypothetical protein